MNETTEKSCWNITLWAVAVVVAGMLVASMVSSDRPGQRTVVTQITSG